MYNLQLPKFVFYRGMVINLDHVVFATFTGQRGFAVRGLDVPDDVHRGDLILNMTTGKQIVIQDADVNAFIKSAEWYGLNNAVQRPPA